MQRSRPSSEGPTYERTSFIRGLITEFEQQTKRYVDAVGKLQEAQAHVALAERMVVATRDAVREFMEDTGDEIVPPNWEDILDTVRFVRVRITDACVELLRDRGPRDTNELVTLLNSGQFRFNTPTPRREVHASLINQKRARRVDGKWEYVPEEEGDGLPV